MGALWSSGRAREWRSIRRALNMWFFSFGRVAPVETRLTVAVRSLVWTLFRQHSRMADLGYWMLTHVGWASKWWQEGRSWPIRNDGAHGLSGGRKLSGHSAVSSYGKNLLFGCRRRNQQHAHGSLSTRSGCSSDAATKVSGNKKGF